MSLNFELYKLPSFNFNSPSFNFLLEVIMNHESDALEQAILKKIEEMEAPDYVFPPRFTRADYITVIACILLCVVTLFLGAGL